VTRGSKYGPLDIACVGFAKTEGEGEDEFSKVFWTSRGEAEYQNCLGGAMPEIIRKGLSDMTLENHGIDYDYLMTHMKKMIDDFGNPTPQLINMGSKSHPYVLALYVKKPEGQAEGKSEGNGGEWRHLRTGAINYREFF